MSKKQNIRDFYKIEEQIGLGRFSIVYKATKKDSNEKRAIKIINKEELRKAIENLEDPEEEELAPYIENYHNEIKNMKISQGRNQENENAVKFYEYFETNDEIASIMESCDDNLLDVFVKSNKCFNS